MNMKIFQTRSFWTDNKFWIITAGAAAVAVTAGYLGRHKIAEGINKVRNHSDPDLSNGNGNRLKSALRLTSITGAAAGVNKLLRRDKSHA